MMAFGPAAGSVYTTNGIRFGIPYQASNGLVSIGDIMMKTGGSPITINNGGR
ncbi:MAG: hypothetical protein IH978_05985 [Nitrospinae bacterium]|nr:hypothetical protein [Nitrospinota bacterium]